MNKIKSTILIIIIFPILYLTWRITRPVEIIAVHDGDTLLVKPPPLLKFRKIAWWHENKKQIYDKYKIPSPDIYGHYMVFVLKYGDGYRIDRWVDEDSNLLCFEEMKELANCIEKKPVFMVGSSFNSKIYYW